MSPVFITPNIAEPLEVEAIVKKSGGVVVAKPMLPLDKILKILVVLATVKSVAGVVVPMPILPALFMVNLEVEEEKSKISKTPAPKAPFLNLMSLYGALLSYKEREGEVEAIWKIV